ncbi:DNA-binding transcriptional LysR family regulator [Paenibacillus taihuensis]|uniref:DNA-binding transcriptional LysR family regulator n=1 Tax=Paenibacillus taihuensis TaxID=1156355 RepID=A0A3D9RN32_9BACL|nr:LysR family transcriptional regulator [Paenibacillus taihuensis]REE81207.1 DNA-binding transcriptional LysR family regulator [Paenibacillus taihuensis]
MELAYFQTFREVALRQSFTRAAEELGYAQSSVTIQIQKLEKAYGVQLFERYGRGLRLTSAGEALLPIVNQMLDLFQQSKERLTSPRGGSLTIGTIDSLASYYLPPFIGQLREFDSELAVRLLPDRESTIINHVKDGTVDIGFILESRPPEDTLSWINIREEKLALVAAPDHPFVKRDRIELEQLDGAEWILPEPTCNYRIMLERLTRKHKLKASIVLELGNPEAIKRCVKAGTGISLLPRMAVEEELQSGALVELAFHHPELKLNLYAIIHPNKWLTHSLEYFISLIKNQ